MRPGCAALVSIGLILLSACAEAPAPGAGTAAAPAGPDLEDLVARLRRTSGGHGITVVVHEAVRQHRPERGVVEFLSEDGTVHLVIGANGTRASPNGESLEVVPRGTVCTIAIAGDGATGIDGAGGNGGDMDLVADTTAEVFLLAGCGGPGADRRFGTGGSGGTGGFARANGHSTGAGSMIGGAGGRAGRPGGSGGAGGGSDGR